MGLGGRRMVPWAVGNGLVRRAGVARTGPGHALGLPVMGSGLIELKFGLGRAPIGEHQVRPMGQVEMEEGALDGGGEGDARDDPHLAAAGRAQGGSTS